MNTYLPICLLNIISRGNHTLDLINEKLRTVFRFKSVLRRHVQFCLIASLIAPVHRKVRSLSKR